MAGKTVIVLGGGIGGVASASLLRKQLSLDDRVVLVNKDEKHLYLPSLLWVTFGWREPKAITRDLSSLQKKGIEVIIGSVQNVNTESRKVLVDSKELAYDYLILALGADLAFDKIPGLVDGSHTFYNLEGALKLNKTLSHFRSGRLAVVVADLPYKCPAAPFEGAMLIEEHLRGRGVREKIDIQVYLPAPIPMGVAGPKVGRAIIQLLESKGISFNPNHKLVSVDKTAGRLTFSEDQEIDYDLLVAIPPHMAPSAVQDSGLAGPKRWIPVNPTTLLTDNPNVYAIGDIAAIKLASGKMLPKAGVFAHAQAHVVASNIASKIDGRRATSSFDGLGNCFIEVGSGKAGFATGNFYAKPEAEVRLKPIRSWWRWLKVSNERQWFRRWFR